MHSHIWSSFKVGFRSCSLLRSLKKLGSLKEHAGFPHWRTLMAEINGFIRLIRRSQVISTKSSATRSLSIRPLLPFTYICDSETSFKFSHLFVHPQAGVSSGRRELNSQGSCEGARSFYRIARRHGFSAYRELH